MVSRLFRMFLAKDTQPPRSLIWSPNVGWLFILLLGHALLLAPAGSWPRSMGALDLLFLPGLIWAERLGLVPDRARRWTLGLGLSYVLLMLVGLLLHYWPGGIPLWAVVIALDSLSLGAWLWPNPGRQGGPPPSLSLPRTRATTLAVLTAILLGAALFRFTELGYSEFQGDEVKALVPAAEALEGREQAFIDVRKKGPGEILAPLMVWRLTGLVNELSVRLPFAVAGMMVVVTMYLLGRDLFNNRVGLLAAGLTAFNGYMVAFSRIVQYQTLVIWMSLLSLMCAGLWRQEGRARWGVLSGTFLGIGVLAHYDAILVAPAIAYLFVANPRRAWPEWRAILAAGLSFVVIVALFFGPFLASPQVEVAGDYLGSRIGLDTRQSSLGEFFYYTIFYNSLYYVVIVGALALGFLAWAMSRALAHISLCYGLPVALLAGVVLVSLAPDRFTIGPLNLAPIPYALLVAGALVSPAISVAQRLVIIWFGAAFLGYLFLIDDPRTHFYAIVPAWLFLAALSAAWLWQRLARRSVYLPLACSTLLVLLFGGHLYVVYLRQNPEYETDWSRSQPWLYWFPYDEMSPHDTFGFVHKVGWKAVGGLYLTGQLQGEYQTNGLYEISDWYTRHRLRGCYRQSQQFFGVSYRLLDLREFPDYDRLGQIELPNDKAITIYQRGAVNHVLESINLAALNHLFDSTATPAAFVQPARVFGSSEVTLADAIQLIDYDIRLAEPAPGGRIGVTLTWQARRKIPVDLDVFVHLEDQAQARVWAQSNGHPVCGELPTSTWALDSPVTDPHVLIIDPATPPGVYTVLAGMYLPQENRRVPIFDETGQPIAEMIELATISVLAKTSSAITNNRESGNIQLEVPAW